MKATGNLQTIVILDDGAHGDTVEATARNHAPGAVVDYRRLNGGIDFEQVRQILIEIANKPGQVTIVQMSWGLPGHFESPPVWVYEDGTGGYKRGLEDELSALVKRGIAIVASAGNDSQGGKIGAGYPACSHYCIPAMGGASFTNRTYRGLVCSESSSSRAASELAAAIAMVRSAGGKYQTLYDHADKADFPSLNLGAALASLGAEADLNPPVEKYQWIPVEAGRVEVSVEPPTKITRYNADGSILRERFGSITAEVKAWKQATVGITGRGARAVNFIRVTR